jgi:hypothetical protein
VGFIEVAAHWLKPVPPWHRLQPVVRRAKPGGRLKARPQIWFVGSGF